MKDEIVYHVILSVKNNIAKKRIARVASLKEAKDIRNRRHILPNQKLWIGKYVNGILDETFYLNNE
jgi:hypothetical protein